MTVEGLQEFGLEEMSDEQIENFLANQGVGVLGLPAGEVPYLLPMSFGYDGDSRLYFSYFLEGDSRKRELSERTEAARFLVYSADSPFFWESVALEGTLAEIPESEWDDHEAALENAWHLDLFTEADRTGEVRLYEFRVESRDGYKYTGIPPGLQAPDDE